MAMIKPPLPPSSHYHLLLLFPFPLSEPARNESRQSRIYIEFHQLLGVFVMWLCATPP